MMRVIRPIRYSRFPKTPKPPMLQRQSARIASRKQPLRARLTEWVGVVLETTVQVLADNAVCQTDTLHRCSPPPFRDQSIT
ncbi:protein of unknown function [Pseudomonas mediterranea]